MTSFRTVTGDDRWTITVQGRWAIDHAERCICDIRLVGMLFACAECGTVLGSVKDMKKPQAQRWVNTRGR